MEELPAVHDMMMIKRVKSRDTCNVTKHRAVRMARRGDRVKSNYNLVLLLTAFFCREHYLGHLELQCCYEENCPGNTVVNQKSYLRLKLNHQ